MRSFHAKDFRRFMILNPSFNAGEGVLRLGYRLDEVEFEEKFTFHNAPQLPAEKLAAFENAIRALACAAGVSYYKAACPSEIALEWDISQGTRQFCQELYTKGLGEFAYVNHLDLTERIHFPTAKCMKSFGVPLELRDRLLVPIGGGKDSLVTLEALKTSGQELAIFFVGDHRQFFEIAEIAGLPVVHVSRELSPNLLEANKQGAYNGHVPISAIIALTAVAAAILYNFRSIAISQERSASEATLVDGGTSVNHQYSKSFEFEGLLANFIASEITPSLEYFSALRHLSELAIARSFSNLRQYHSRFSSCNKAYRIAAESNGKQYWCNDCPKCRFVFLALAPFMSVEQLTSIFGDDLLAQESQMKGFESLLGYQADKPFECVGEREESLTAFMLLAEGCGDERWKDHVIVRSIAERLLPSPVERERLKQKYFTADTKHRIPARFQSSLCASKN